MSEERNDSEVGLSLCDCKLSRHHIEMLRMAMREFAPIDFAFRMDVSVDDARRIKTELMDIFDGI